MQILDEIKMKIEYGTSAIGVQIKKSKNESNN